MNRPAIRAISLATGGGLVFSWALMRLGSDMESPELLRYILIATLPLTLLLMLALIQFRVRSIRRTLFAGFVLSAIMCIPMESFAFVISEWSLRGSEVFERNHLPLTVVAACCMGGRNRHPCVIGLAWIDPPQTSAEDFAGFGVFAARLKACP